MRCSYACVGALTVAAAASGPNWEYLDHVFPTKLPQVSVKAFGAKGDGKTDDWLAIQTAVNQSTQYELVYFPPGNYLVSDTIACPTYHGGVASRHVFQGHSALTTTITLRDSAPGFNNASMPKAVIECSHGVAQAFYNHVFAMTVNTGSQNPGAVGVRFQTNNMGSCRELRIVSGDGAGFAGLDLGYTDQNGPLAISKLEVHGFGWSLFTAHNVDSQVVEHVYSRGASLGCVANFGQTLLVRGLDCVTGSSANSGFLQVSHGGSNVAFTTLIDSSLALDDSDVTVRPTALPVDIVPGGSLEALGYSSTTGRRNSSSLVPVRGAAINGTVGMWHVRNVTSGAGFNYSVQQYAFNANRTVTQHTLAAGTVQEFLSHDPVRLWTDDAVPFSSLNLPILETPAPPLESELSKWVIAVGNGTQVGSNVTYNCSVKEVNQQWWPDCSDRLNEVLTSSTQANTLFFPPVPPQSGYWYFYNNVSVPATVSRIEFAGVQVAGSAFFIVDQGDETDPPLILEQWVGNYGGDITVYHRSKRTVVLRDVDSVRYLPDCDGSPGDVFIDDLVGPPIVFCGGQRAFARQLNTENTGLDVLVTGAGTSAVLLGHKIEKGLAGIVNVTGGASFDSLSTFYYSTPHSDTPLDSPRFAVDADSRASVSYREYNADCNPANVLAWQQRRFANGSIETRQALRTSGMPSLIPGHGATGCAPAMGFSLFVGYSTDQSEQEQSQIDADSA